MLPLLLSILIAVALVAWSPVFAFAYWRRSLHSDVRPYVWIGAWMSAGLGTVVVLAMTGMIHEFLSWQ